MLWWMNGGTWQAIRYKPLEESSLINRIITYYIHYLSLVFQRPTATTGDLDQLCTRYVAAHQVLERTL